MVTALGWASGCAGIGPDRSEESVGTRAGSAARQQSGSTRSHINHALEFIGCRETIRSHEFCGGLGIVEVEVTHRWRKGRALRERRVHKRGLAQEQFGRRLGIDPTLLNDVEWGRAELPTHVEQRLLEELE